MDAERAREVGDDWEREDALAREVHECEAGAYPEYSDHRVPPPCGRRAVYWSDGYGIYMCLECAREAGGELSPVGDRDE